MKSGKNAHLAYCTNIHRGETWDETLSALNRHTLSVKERVAPGEAYGVGLRLGAAAADDLTSGGRLDELREWLHVHQCYVFTINGFPYGQFHGTRVKEQVYAPDWSRPERLEYTRALFQIVAQLAADAGLQEASVSTLPGSFKEFVKSEEHASQIRENLLRCVLETEKVADETGLDLHLGLEPEPLGYFETSKETVSFFERLVDTGKARGIAEDMILRRIGVNYDTCHLACEYEDAAMAIGRLSDARIRISKFHLSSALRVIPTPEAREKLRDFTDDVYLHQVLQRSRDGSIHRWRDLPDALSAGNPPPDVEWRIHFHIPLHAEPESPFSTTIDHLEDTISQIRENPGLCSHLEMETYTWDVLPPDLRSDSVVDQLVREYEWTLARLNDA